MRILGIDPGETTGYGLLQEKKVLMVGQVKLGEFPEWLRDFPVEQEVDVFVIEDYIQRPNYMMKDQARNRLWIPQTTAKLIGRIQQTAFLLEKPCVLQQPDKKPIGYGMAGLTYVKGKKGTHIQDAVAHATYWWMTKGRKLCNGDVTLEQQTD